MQTLQAHILHCKPFMDDDFILYVINRFKKISHSLANEWGRPDIWEDIYSDMCCALIKKRCRFLNKPFAYIVKACKNDAINSYLSGKSVCSKPRENVKIISIEKVSGNISSPIRFEEQVHLKLLVEKIFKLLTPRQREVASFIMNGYTEKEIAGRLKVSQQRISQVKKEIQRKLHTRNC